MNSPSPTLRRVESLIAGQRLRDAAEALLRAPDDDAAALYEAAHWRVVGNIIRRDLGQARDLLRRAWQAGLGEAGLHYASFLASGVGGADDWAQAVAVLRRLERTDYRAAAQLHLIAAMKVDDAGNPALALPRKPLSTSPHVEASEGFFTPEECAYVLALGEPQLQPSMIVDPNTRQMVPHPIRRSEGAAFGVFLEDVAINTLNRRIAALSGTTIAQGETLQILRYRVGDEYREHLDVLPAEPNQRVMTVLVYLNADYEGGETAFPKVGLKYRGQTGDALFFRNVTGDGAADMMSQHAGLPVTRGTKIIASRWIRSRPSAFPPPPPMLDL